MIKQSINTFNSSKYRPYAIRSAIIGTPLLFAIWANADTLETVISGVVINNETISGADLDELGLIPGLVDENGAFTGAGQSFTFTYTWDADLAAPYFYDHADTDAAPRVLGVSTDERAPNGVIKSMTLEVGGKTVNFGPDPDFYTINAYPGEAALESLFRNGDDFIYFKAAGITGLPERVDIPFSSGGITKGFPSFATISIVNGLRKTEFGFDIDNISVAALDSVPPTGSIDGASGGGGEQPVVGGIDIDGPGTPVTSADVPIPAALPLFALAVGGLAAISRKQRKAKT
jgi:hypothetical protein